MYPGLLTMAGELEQANQTYLGLNLGSTNGADQTQFTASDTGPAPATAGNRKRRTWTAAQRQAASARAKANAKARKTAGKAMSAGG